MNEAASTAVAFWGVLLMAPIFYIIVKFVTRERDTEIKKEPGKSGEQIEREKGGEG